ncbi:hypothetical protein NMD97_03710 [Edwardsiella tarda]
MTNQRADFFQPADYDDVYTLLSSERIPRSRIVTPSYQPGATDGDTPVLIVHNASRQVMEVEPHMNAKSLSRLEFWLGIIATIAGVLSIVIGATWTISNTISEKIDASRKEITGNIQSNRTDITTRIDRLEDKMDSNLKDISSNMYKIQATLEAKSAKEK